MIPVDKFGRPIYGKVFTRLKRQGAVLEENGYRESQKKPNLFYRKDPSCGMFFADMRGTEDIPVWEDTSPLFYWQSNSEVAPWLRRRHIKNELIKLFHSGCPCRLASNDLFDTVEFSGAGYAAIYESEGIFDWPDGYCKFCGKDFQAEGEFCSEKCKELHEDSKKTPCPVCNRKLSEYDDGVIRHHVKYFPAEICLVHRSCHNKIHFSDLFPHLRPSKEEIAEFYKILSFKHNG